MRSVDPTRHDGEERPILPWRLVAGGFLHVVIPAYVIALPIDLFLSAPGVSTAEAGLRFVLGFSGRFLAIYAAIAVIATLASALIDPQLRRAHRRRAATHPEAAARASQRRASEALAGAKALTGESGAAVRRIAEARWDHADPRCQALSRDLADVVRTCSAALASATPDGRPGITDLATNSLARIEAELAALAAERRRLDEGDARAVAHYVGMRYGTSDFAGDGD